MSRHSQQVQQAEAFKRIAAARVAAEDARRVTDDARKVVDKSLKLLKRPIYPG